MALFDNFFDNWGTGLLIGVGVALAAPLIIPAMGTVIRPLAKSAIKGGMIVGDKLKEMTCEFREQMSDLVVEAKAEHAASVAKGGQPVPSSATPARQPAK